MTVDVIRSRPGDLAPPGSSATFTVDSNTLVLGGSSSDSLFGGSLSDVNVGDLVAGGVAGPAGETLAQIEATPLKVLLDLPGSSASTTSSSHHRAGTRVLKRALALLGDKGSTRHRGSHRHRGTRKQSHHARRR